MDIDSGSIDITLDGEVYHLTPTLGALQQIDRQLGSMRTAIERCGALNLNALVTIISAGAQLDKTQEKALPEVIFRTGIANVAGDVAAYLTLLLNPSGESASGDDETARGKA